LAKQGEDAEDEKEGDNAPKYGELRISSQAPQVKRLNIDAAPSIFRLASSAPPAPSVPAASSTSSSAVGVVPAASVFAPPIPTTSPSSNPTWLMPGLVVQINSSKVGNGKLKNEKAVIVTVSGSPATCEVLLLKSGLSVLNVEEKRLDTVLPNVGGKVKIVQGPKRGTEAVLEAVNAEQYTAKVGGVELPFEHLCKVFE